MPLARSTPGTKLLARHEHDNGSFPFATGNWTVAADLTLSLSSSKLVFTVNTSSAWRWARLDTIASRSKTFAYIEYEASTVGPYLALAAHVSDITAGSRDGVGYFGNVASSSVESGINEAVNDAGTLIQGGSVGAKAADTAYYASLFVDGSTVRGRDFSGGATYTGTAPTHSSGQVAFGLIGASGQAYRLRRLIVCPDRFTTVAGVPTGGSAEVRKADDTVLASASESSGTASINMEIANLHLATKLVVKNSGGTVLATYEVAGEIIEPGETYEYTLASILLDGTALLSITGAGALSTAIPLAGAATLQLTAAGELTAVTLTGAATVAVTASGSLTTAEAPPTLRWTQKGAALFLGSGRGRVHRFDHGVSDAGANAPLKILSRAVAPAGISGEAMFTKLYLTIRNLRAQNLTITPIVNGVRKAAMVLQLPERRL